MKKSTKLFAVLLSAIIALSAGVVQAFAAESSESEIVWRVERSKIGHTSSWQVTYYDDGTFERFASTFCYIVVTVPEGVEPSLEYFGVDRINYVAKFEEKFMYQTQYGEEIWSELEPGENEYIIHMTLDGFQTVCELEDEATELARNLMAEGKITSARVNYQVFRDTFYDLGGIEISTNKTYTNSSIDDVKPSDYPELAGFYDENSDCFEKGLGDEGTIYSIYEKYTNKDILTNILSVCDSLVENYDYIVSAKPIYPYVSDIGLSSDEPDLYVANSIYMWGDISRDNSIDLYDAVEISKYIMKISDIDEDTVLLADINRDGRTDLYDVIEIARTLMEK